MPIGLLTGFLLRDPKSQEAFLPHCTHTRTWLQLPANHSTFPKHGPLSHGVVSEGLLCPQPSNGKLLMWLVMHTTERVRTPVPQSTEHCCDKRQQRFPLARFTKWTENKLEKDKQVQSGCILCKHTQKSRFCYQNIICSYCKYL